MGFTAAPTRRAREAARKDWLVMGAQVSIGDFSVMTRLSRKALRHYHDVGLLEPAHVDPHSGYRFYDTSQVDRAHIIQRFRYLGVSIPDVKALLTEART